MKWVRILALLAVIALAAIAVAVITLNSLDLSRYQDPIVAQVQAATGRKLTIDGELRLHIGLRPAVAVEGLSFQNAGWSETPSMVTLKRFAVRLSLLPLLVGKVEVGRVELVGARILLETNAQGVGNWIFTPPKAATGSAPRSGSRAAGTPSGTAAEPAAEEPAPALMAMVRQAVVEDASVVYRDGATGRSQSVEIERLIARMKDETAPLRLELTGRYNAEPFRLDATLEGGVGLLAGERLGLELEAKAGGATVEARGGIEKPLDAQGIDLGLIAEGESLARLAGLAGSPLPALGPYRLSAKIAGGGSEYRVRELVVALGGSEIRGSATAKLGGKRPLIEADLRSPLLDLADFQEAATETASPERQGVPASGGGGEAGGAVGSRGGQEGEGSGGGGDGRLFPDDPLPLDGLRVADAKLALAVDELRSGDLRLEKLGLGLALTGGRLRAEPLDASLLGGSLTGLLALDAAAPVPALETSLSIAGLEAGKLLTALQASERLSGGELTLDLDLSGKGGSVRRLMASLSGQAELSMDRGVLQGRWADLGLAELGPLLTGVEDGERTAINCVVSEFAVSQGVARVESLVVDTEAVALFGSGRVDLGSEKLGLRLDPVDKSGKLAGALPPARIGGRLAKPSVGIDANATTEKALDVIADLALGKDLKQGEKIRTQAGVEGCRQLLAARAESGSGKAGTRTDARKKLKRAGKKQLKKHVGKSLEDAARSLENLLDR